MLPVVRVVINQVVVRSDDLKLEISEYVVKVVSLSSQSIYIIRKKRHTENATGLKLLHRCIYSTSQTPPILYFLHLMGLLAGGLDLSPKKELDKMIL